MKDKRGRHGNALIEFSLSFALLWAVFSGVFQFGYSIFVYNSLVQAIAEGAHFAARVDFDSPDHAFVTQVKNMVVYGAPTAGGAPLAPGLTTDNVTVTWTTDAKGYPLALTVGITGYTTNGLFHSYTFSDKPRVTVRFLGRYLTEG